MSAGRTASAFGVVSHTRSRPGFVNVILGGRLRIIRLEDGPTVIGAVPIIAEAARAVKRGSAVRAALRVS